MKTHLISLCSFTNWIPWATDGLPFNSRTCWRRRNFLQSFSPSTLFSHGHCTDKNILRGRDAPFEGASGQRLRLDTQSSSSGTGRVLIFATRMRESESGEEKWEKFRIRCSWTRFLCSHHSVSHVVLWRRRDEHDRGLIPWTPPCGPWSLKCENMTKSERDEMRESGPRWVSISETSLKLQGKGWMIV